MSRKREQTVPWHPPRERFPGPVSAEKLGEIFSDCYDFERRELVLPGGVRGELVFLDGLTSGKEIAEYVLRPLTEQDRFGGVTTPEQAVRFMMSGRVYGYTVKRRQALAQVVDDLLNGFCAVVFDDAAVAVTFEVRATDKRAIDEPKEEKPMKGSKDVFIEILKVNSMLVRRRLHEPMLRFHQMTVGRRTRTAVTVVYIQGLTDPALVREMRRRLARIDVDGVNSVGAVEHRICDRPGCVFPQLLRTERPDRFAANLLEGRVGLLIDGLPMGLLAPATLVQFMKMPEDDAYHFAVSSVLTVLRFFALLLSLLLPAVYVAVAMYHQEMIPTRLMQTMIQSKQSVPFPTAVEALGMLLAFEILQEAGLRLPAPVGQTVSIIGALIVGQSAVEAKVVSPVVVIIVALSGIAGYTTPNTDLAAAVRLWRFLFVLAAACGGFFGMMAAFCVLVCRLCDLESFGADYMYPLSSGSLSELLRGVAHLPPDREKLRWPETNTPNRRKQR